MKDEQRSDQTEDFLRKFLTDYRETPSDAVWEGIEYRLETPAPSVGHFAWKWAAAALALAFVGQFWYFQHKLHRLSQQKQPQTPTLSAPANPSTSQAVLPLPQLNPTQPEKTPSATEPSARYQADPIVFFGQSLPALPFPQYTPETAPATAAFDQPNIQDTKTTAPAANESPVANLSVAPIALLEKPNPGLTTPGAGFQPGTVPSLTRPHRPGRFSVEAFGMFVTAKQKEVLQPDRFPDHDDNFNRRFSQPEKESRVKGWRTGALLAYKLDRHWSLTGGLAVRQTVQTVTHKPRPEFRDGKHHNDPPHGPNQEPVDFDMTLYGGGTASSVTLQVETQQSTNLPPNRELKFQLSTDLKSRYLEFPLGLQFTQPLGPVHLNLRAGAISSFLEKREVTLNMFDLTDQDDKIKVPAGFRPSLQSTPYRKFSVAGWAAGSASFAITTRLRISTDVWYTYHGSKTGLIDLKEKSLGIGAGLVYKL